MFMGADRLGTNSGMDETGMAFFAAKYVQMSGAGSGFAPNREATGFDGTFCMVAFAREWTGGDRRSVQYHLMI